jgi:hypothetical protein
LPGCPALAFAVVGGGFGETEYRTAVRGQLLIPHLYVPGGQEAQAAALFHDVMQVGVSMDPA